MATLVALVNSFGPVIGCALEELMGVCRLTRELCEEIEKVSRSDGS